MKLILKKIPQARVDAAQLTPQFCHEQSVKTLAACMLKTSQGQVALGELFDIKEDSSAVLVLDGDFEKFDYLGAQMTTGHIVVHGSVGDYAGATLSGGQLDIHGNAGSYSACAMSGGTLVIDGDVQDRTGGARRGAVCGMLGGSVVVLGRAGDRTGDSMRRGLIVVRGNNGDYCASKMKAGTIVILGTNGNHTSYGMKRGTVLLNTSEVELGDTFVRQPGSYNMEFLVLVFKHIRSLSSQLQSLPIQKLVCRQIGDLAVGGKGEILTSTA